RFIHYRYAPGDPASLSNDVVQSIYEDQNRDLWIGTDEGLNKFDRSKEEFIRFQHDPADTHGLTDKKVSAVYQDRTGC
ncbi:MAG: hypothetical protein GWN00_38605, partial [Aliifodinibius sp.]|nr:hypothetical protein [Fodinibius sp.]NIV16532.1 hypothetical protein [Fodinibius sp.]NIY30483.1 hypothetical protein [Fodinibius sp.]